jgi:hypothetical protein
MITARQTSFLVVTGMLSFAVAAKADLLFTCTAGSACDGDTYAVSVVSQTGSTYVMEFDIQIAGIGGAGGYTGSATDVVEAIGIKSFLSGNNISNLAVVAAPGGAANRSNWSIYYGELDTSGTCGPMSGGTPRICLEATGSYAGAPLPSTFPAILTWQFQFTDPTDTPYGNPDGVGDIKFLYEDTNDKKVGSLGSFPIDLQTGTTVAHAPEPSSVVLFGTVLASTCIGLRKLLAKG